MKQIILWIIHKHTLFFFLVFVIVFDKLHKHTDSVTCNFLIGLRKDYFKNLLYS